MKRVTSDRDFYDNIEFSDNPEGWEKEKARREKEEKKKHRRERLERWKNYLILFLGKTLWAVFVAIIGALIMWIKQIITGK